MNSRIHFAFTIFSAGLVSLAAQAADIPAPGPSLAPPPPLLASGGYNWEGYYAGLHAGYGRTYDDKVGIHHITNPGGVLTVRNIGGNLKAGGVLGGLQAGYNWQTGALVYGVEADVTLMSGKSTFSGLYPAPIAAVVTTSASRDWSGTLRARIGYAFGQALIYSTAGISATNVKYSLVAFGGTPLSTSNVRLAPVFGGGIEYAINNNWSAKVEGLYTLIPKKSLPLTPFGAPAFLTTSETQAHWQVRLGLNYRFGGPAGAVVAKY